MFHQLDRLFRAQDFSHILPIAVALLSLVILLPHSAEATPQASIRYVAKSGSNSGTCSTSGTACLTVQYAVDQAVAGDAIHIAAGTYTSVTLRTGTYQQVYIRKTLTLQGGYTTTDSFATSNPVANPTILDAQGGGRVVYFNGVDGSVSNLSIQNGNFGGDGGGIYISNALTLTNVTVLSNTADEGGGAYVSGIATLNGGVFQNNRAYDYGGGLYTFNTLALSGTQFLSNTATDRKGGGAYAGGPATLNGGLFQNNFSDFSGGGLYAYSTLALTDTRFFDNVSGSGGGAFVSGTATLNGGLFQNNFAQDYGGGLYTVRVLVLSATQFLSNTANGGGGAEVGGAATLNGGLFQNNRAGGYGGGGLDIFATFALTGTHFLSNTADYGGGLSGGVDAGQTGRIVNTLFARNVATSTLGSAMYLYAFGSSSVQILHTTIARPTLGSGSAIYIQTYQTSTVGITDTIISNYSIGISRTAGSVYENYNLFSGVVVSKSGSFVAGSGANDVIGNPNFVNPSVDNYHLAVGAAIGRAANVGVNVDLDGNPRPGITGFDIGAYQYTGALFRVYLPLALKNF